MRQVRREAGSFRDPSGYVLRGESGVFRSLSQEAHEVALDFLEGPAYHRLAEQGLVIGSEPVDDANRDELRQTEGVSDRSYIRHVPLWRVNYPYEWPPQMLADAGRATCAVQSEVMRHGFNLKDASAYNIQFELGEDGPLPTFIDVGSIERFPDNGGVWVPYRQFLSHYLLPVLYNRKLDYSYADGFLGDMDGLDPEHAYRMTGTVRRLFPPYLTLVTLPHMLRGGDRKRTAKSGARSDVGREKDLFVLRHTLRSLRRKMDRVARGFDSSEWTDYEQTKSYTDEAGREKADFVSTALARVRPETALDIGCNTGKFSLMAAHQGAKVLALDTDLASLDMLYRRARELRAPVLPLRVDVTNPSPAIGWENRERPSFLDRAGHFDCVMALAVTHHLVVGKGIPLTEVARLLHRLTSSHLLVELTGPEDPMFQSLLRGRESLYSDLSIDYQEMVLGERFSILDSRRLTGMHRGLYLMKKR